MYVNDKKGIVGKETTREQNHQSERSTHYKRGEHTTREEGTLQERRAHVHHNILLTNSALILIAGVEAYLIFNIQLTTSLQIRL